VTFHERRKGAFLLAGLALLACAGLLAMLAGAYSISLGDVQAVLAAQLPGGDGAALDPVHRTVVWEIRLPRILVGALVGLGLATAGAVYQGVFRNPLVEPFILGVSAGASFGASLAILLPAVIPNLQIGAFAFALVAVGMVYFSSRTGGRNPIVGLILAGVIVSSLFQALVSILKYASDDAALRAIVFWIMGGLYYASWKDVAILLPVMTAGVALVWSLSWRLNVLSMGDEEARTLGVHPERLKLVFVLCATLMTAVAVSSVGIIAWVGLMMPHAARMVLGPDHRYVIPAAAVMGATYLLVCDTLARTLTGTEIPISIITSIVGAPYLFFLLRTRTRFAFSG
jgi:iron complex transport system permease protein